MDAKKEKLREAMARAKKLPEWDRVPHALHVELDVIFAALTALPEQVKSEDARDAERLEYLLTAGVSLVTHHRNGDPYSFNIVNHEGKIITPDCATQRAAIDAAIYAQESKK